MTDDVRTMTHDVRARLAAMGLGYDPTTLEGTERFVGVCRACGQRVRLVRGCWCPVCGAGRGLEVEA